MVAEVEVSPDSSRVLPKDRLIEGVKRCDILLSLLHDTVDRDVLMANPQLKAVSSMNITQDRIDLTEATARGIPVTNIPAIVTDATADIGFGLLLAVARNIARGDKLFRSGVYPGSQSNHLAGAAVSGQTLGLVGFGRIGQAMAKRARGFGMTVLYHDVHRADAAVEAEHDATFLPLEELLPRSDFVTLHVNLTDQTEGLMNAEKLGWMKPTAVLVNTSRGPVVDGAALATALKAGTIFAAGLDVTDPEPIPMDHPLVGLDNCLIVPHIASASRATRGKMAEMAAANLLAGVRGERLPTPVNPEVYDRA